MSYHIAEKGSMRMVGVRIPLSADMEENQKNIPQFWQSVLSGNLFSEICKLANRSPQGILGVSVYENPKSFFYYIAAATDAPVPNGMFAFEIPAAVWAVFGKATLHPASAKTSRTCITKAGGFVPCRGWRSTSA